jgi:hypothetical protein
VYEHRVTTAGEELERFWPSRRLDAFDEFCRRDG